jgi:hypothetical protein
MTLSRSSRSSSTTQRSSRSPPSKASGQSCHWGFRRLAGGCGAHAGTIRVGRFRVYEQCPEAATVGVRRQYCWSAPPDVCTGNTPI